MLGKRYAYKMVFVLCLCLVVSGCSEIELASHYTKKMMSSWNKTSSSSSKGTYKVGSPYKIAGRWYRPKEDFNLVQTGVASWYGPGFHGKKTANGEIYDQYAMTAAHKTLQLPAIVKVTNLENRRSVVVRINDRGPYEKGRIIDLSKAAANKLGIISKGTARVRVQVLSEQSRKVAALAKRGHDTRSMQYVEAQPSQTKIHIKSHIKNPAVYQANGSIAFLAQPAYLTNNATMDYEPMGKIHNAYLPESLQRPVMTTKQVQTQSESYGSINTPNWNAADKSVTAYSSTGQESEPSSYQVASNYAMRPLSQGRDSLKPVTIQNTAVSQTDNVYIQAGAFSVYDNADRLSKKLASVATVHIREIQVKDKRLYRVRLGPLKTVQEARMVEENIRETGYNDPMRIVVYD